MNNKQREAPPALPLVAPLKRDELLYKDEVYQITGCAMEVLNILGHGLFEKLYEKALIIELNNQNIPNTQQKQFDVVYKEIKIGKYIPDLIVFDKIVVEVKSINHITTHERGQILNYLKVTKLKVGIILNFKHAKLEWERLIL